MIYIINNTDYTLSPQYKTYKAFSFLNEFEKSLIDSKTKNPELFFFCIENNEVIDVVREPKDFKLKDGYRIATSEEEVVYNAQVLERELIVAKGEKHEERRVKKEEKESLFTFDKIISLDKKGKEIKAPVIFQSDDNSINRLDAKININNFETTIWIDKDNNENTFSKEELIIMAKEMRRMQDVVAIKNSKIAKSIDSAKSVEELNNLIIEF